MANYVQEKYRWGLDDDTEALATFDAAQNTDITFTSAGIDINRTIRISVANTTAGGAVASSWMLYASYNGGAYAIVTTSTSRAKTFNSSNLTDDGATTNRLTGATGTFLAGGIAEDGTYDNGGSLFTITNGRFSEFLYPITIIDADLNHNDTLDFRVYRSGAVLNTYSATARVTMNKPGGQPYVKRAGGIQFMGIQFQRRSGVKGW